MVQAVRLLAVEAMVLSHPRIQLGSAAVGDVAEGRVDPRVLQVLLFLAERHDLGSVGPLITGHSYFGESTTDLVHVVPVHPEAGRDLVIVER